MDEAGQIQPEQRVRTSAKALRDVFGAMPRGRIALETGTHPPRISGLLSELGHEVIVAHAREVRNYTECPEGLYKYWMSHAGKDMSDLYDKIKEDVAFLRKWAERCRFGFELPSLVPNVPKTAEKTEAAEAV